MISETLLATKNITFVKHTRRKTKCVTLLEENKNLLNKLRIKKNISLQNKKLHKKVCYRLYLKSFIIYIMYID